jgi:hypothetical protein
MGKRREEEVYDHQLGRVSKAFCRYERSFLPRQACTKIAFFTLVILVHCKCLSASTLHAFDEATPGVPGGRDVSWGISADTTDKSDKNPLMEIVPPADTSQGMLIFEWTDATGQKHTGYDTYIAGANATNRAIPTRLFLPKNTTITDWRQTVTNGDGTSNVRAGNLKRDSPWILQPLDDIAGSYFRIPDLAPTSGGQTIYAAVNFNLYLANNPQGFLNGQWALGQTLSSLGLTITNGQIPGVEGILWATTEFVFDANSDIGWSPIGGASALLNSVDFQEANGDITILAAHTTMPEPSTMLLISLGCVGLLILQYRRRVVSN